MKRKIKLSGITDLAGARACAALPIDYLGLNLDPRLADPMPPLSVPDIVQWLQGVKTVAEIPHFNQQKALKLGELLKVDEIQLVGEHLEKAKKNIWVEKEELSAAHLPAKLIYKTELNRLNNISAELKNSQVFLEMDYSQQEAIDWVNDNEWPCISIQIAHFKNEDGIDLEKLSEVCVQLSTTSQTS